MTNVKNTTQHTQTVYRLISMLLINTGNERLVSIAIRELFVQYSFTDEYCMRVI